jgi:RNA polymerase sigma-70 factor (ECF subfamily)
MIALMSEPDPLVSALYEGKRRFLALVADIRPDLHRYCARMTGSTSDGEDVVQDTLARAYYALSEMDAVPELRPWLFRIAHNRALDYRRRYEHRMSEPLDHVLETEPDLAGDPESALAREQATRAALSRFIELPPSQRSAVILKDVLGHSIAELSGLLGLSGLAAKAALHRGRERLRALAESGPPTDLPEPSAGVARYVALFNARDWDGVRALLAEDVRLDLVSRVRRSGRVEVSSYFSNYSKYSDWHLVQGSVDGAEVILVYRESSSARPHYFIELGFDSEQQRVVWIRDFRYVPYILTDAASRVSTGA